MPNTFRGFVSRALLVAATTPALAQRGRGVGGQLGPIGGRFDSTATGDASMFAPRTAPPPPAGGGGR
ncbi:MAG TPA: hypothetical protein VMH39_14840 [Gemmatimonadaceae bacterium]|nr:hypothetical protein [Gemmatimonadaceae bacterium]